MRINSLPPEEAEAFKEYLQEIDRLQMELIIGIMLRAPHRAMVPLALVESAKHSARASAIALLSFFDAPIDNDDMHREAAGEIADYVRRCCGMKGGQMVPPEYFNFIDEIQKRAEAFREAEAAT